MTDLARCPVCALPLQWVHFPGSRFSRSQCEGWQRHQQLQVMHRAASACFAAGYQSEGERISAEVDRLRGGRASTAAA